MIREDVAYIHPQEAMRSRLYFASSSDFECPSVLRWIIAA